MLKRVKIGEVLKDPTAQKIIVEKKRIKAPSTCFSQLATTEEPMANTSILQKTSLRNNILMLERKYKSTGIKMLSKFLLLMK